jgi:hypothetical protein
MAVWEAAKGLGPEHSDGLPLTALSPWWESELKAATKP